MSLVCAPRVAMGLMILFTLSASAAPMRYTLYNVVFEDGGTASGSFLYDAATNTYSDVNITTTDGTLRSGATYTVVNNNLPARPDFVLNLTSTAADQTGSPGMSLNFLSPLVSSPGVVPLLGLEGTCANPLCLNPTSPMRTSSGGWVLAEGAPAQDAVFQVRYVANLNVADALINISNTGANGAMPFGPGIGSPAGNLCVNVYAFSPDEQMVGCCSCHVTPNGLVSLSVYNDIRQTTLTGLTPNSMVIKLVATATGGTPSAPVFNGGASACSQSAAGLNTSHPLANGGLVAWTTTAHVPGALPVPAAPAPFAITETKFTPATLSEAERISMVNRCASIIGNGSTYGTCRGCTPGGRGSSKY